MPKSIKNWDEKSRLHSHKSIKLLNVDTPVPLHCKPRRNRKTWFQPQSILQNMKSLSSNFKGWTNDSIFHSHMRYRRKIDTNKNKKQRLLKGKSQWVSVHNHTELTQTGWGESQYDNLVRHPVWRACPPPWCPPSECVQRFRKDSCQLYADSENKRATS